MRAGKQGDGSCTRTHIPADHAPGGSPPACTPSPPCSQGSPATRHEAGEQKQKWVPPSLLVLPRSPPLRQGTDSTSAKPHAEGGRASFNPGPWMTAGNKATLPARHDQGCLPAVLRLSPFFINLCISADKPALSSLMNPTWCTKLQGRGQRCS